MSRRGPSRAAVRARSSAITRVVRAGDRDPRRRRRSCRRRRARRRCRARRRRASTARTSACVPGETTASGAGCGSSSRRASRSGVLLPPRCSMRTASSRVTWSSPTTAASARDVGVGRAETASERGASAARHGVGLAGQHRGDERLGAGAEAGRSPCPRRPRRSGVGGWERRPGVLRGRRESRRGRRRIHGDSMTHSVWLSHGRCSGATPRPRSSTPRSRKCSRTESAGRRHPTSPGARRSSRQTLYRYWPDVQALFAALVTRELFAVAARAVGPSDDARRVRRRARRDRRPHPAAAARGPAARDRPRAVLALHPRAAGHEPARHPRRDRGARQRRSGRRIRPRGRPRTPRRDGPADRPVRGPVGAARRGVAARRASGGASCTRRSPATWRRAVRSR